MATNLRSNQDEPVVVLEGDRLDDWLGEYNEAEIAELRETWQKYASPRYKNLLEAEVVINGES